nr:uncharacterized protein LOC127333400 [Lolium perenne]
MSSFLQTSSPSRSRPFFFLPTLTTGNLRRSSTPAVLRRPPGRLTTTIRFPTFCRTPRRRLARPGLARISRFMLDCELSHGVFVPDLRLVLGQNGRTSRSNQNPSLQLSDPWMGLGPGSLPGVSPLSCASNSLEPAQKTAQHLLLPG